jgi:hypothetical protein
MTKTENHTCFHINLSHIIVFLSKYFILLINADIDECDTSPCSGPTSTCNNFDGGFSCSCGTGYELNGNVCVGMLHC